LPRHAVEDMRVIVAVTDAPPRRDAIDQLAAVGEDDAATVCTRRGQRGGGELHLAVGKPYMRKTLFIPVKEHELCRIQFWLPRVDEFRCTAPFLFIVSGNSSQSRHRDVDPAKLTEAVDRVGEPDAFYRFRNDDRLKNDASTS
jgi:hypothetical protein